MTRLADGGFEDRTFADGGGISFAAAVDGEARSWWRTAFSERLGWTPEDVGGLLSKSWPGPKRFVVAAFDGRQRRCAIKVQGALGEAEFWLSDGAIDLLGPAINADRMFAPGRQSSRGIGRSFMRDVVAFAKAAGIGRIRLDAARVGRYAWLRMGVVPDRGSWNALVPELTHRLSAAHADVGRRRFDEILEMIRSPHPETARELAALGDRTASRELVGPDARRATVPMGRALFLEIAASWSGELALGDPAALGVVESGGSAPDTLLAGTAAVARPGPFAEKQDGGTPMHPSHRWGPFAEDPDSPELDMDVGEGAWMEAVAAARRLRLGIQGAADGLRPGEERDVR